MDMIDSPKRAGERSLRHRMRWLVRTPLHPQWLMPVRWVAAPVLRCEGVVLDIGSADRWLQWALSEKAHYVALDYPVTAVGMYGSRPDVFADAHKLPFADNSIGAVACFEVLEHVTEPDAVISEIARVLSAGGIVAFSMPFLYPVHDAPYDFQRWTAHRWQRSLAGAGLKVESIEPANHPLHASAVLAGLALTGPLLSLNGWRRVWFLPLLLVILPCINLAAWVLARVWPNWKAMTTTLRVLARKPA